MSNLSIYLDKMSELGYKDAGRASDIFKDTYARYKADSGLYSTAKARDLRLDRVCAAIAHLKASKYLGYKWEDAFEIRTLWELSDGEYDVVADILYDNLDGYHLEAPSGYSQRALEAALVDEKKKSDMRSVRTVSFIHLTVLVILMVALRIANSYCSRDDYYEEVLVPVVGCSTAFNKETFAQEYTFYVRYDGAERQLIAPKVTYLSGYDRGGYKYYLEQDDLSILDKASREQVNITAYRYGDDLYLYKNMMERSRPCYIAKTILYYVIGLTVISDTVVTTVIVIRKNREQN